MRELRVKAGWCIHYTGLLGRAGEPREGRRCNAGVLYDEVKRLPEPGRGYKLPCLGNSDTECALRVAVTPEQEAESERIALERIALHARVIRAGHCPHCGLEMTSRKIGRCIYAKPCGHRLNEIPHEIKGTEFVEQA
jgi:hypothetical protein